MKKFFLIFRYELLRMIKARSYLTITLVMMIALAVGLSLPRFRSGNEAIDVPAGEADTVLTEALLLAPEGEAEALRLVLLEHIPGTAISLAETEDAGALEEAVDSGAYDWALRVLSDTEYQFYETSQNATGATEVAVYEAMTRYRQLELLGEQGIGTAEAKSLLDARPTYQVVRLGEDPMDHFLSTYIMLFLLYMAIMLYGTMVSSGVGTEKSTRAMEILITSARPTQLMFGKVLGLGTAGLLQLLAVLVTGKVAYTFNAAYWAGSPMVSAIFNIAPVTLLYTLLFFVLGFFLYAFLYGAVGSLVNSTEELSSAIMPITLIFIAVFMIVIFGTTSGQVDSGAMLIASFVPFSSPMAMFARINMGSPALWEVVLSVGILVASVGLIGYAAAGIYRLGVLLYGQKPSLATLWRAIRRKEG